MPFEDFRCGSLPLEDLRFTALSEEGLSSVNEMGTSVLGFREEEALARECLREAEECFLGRGVEGSAGFERKNGGR